MAKTEKINYENLPLFFKLLQYLLKIIAGTTHDHHLAHHLKHISCKYRVFI